MATFNAALAADDGLEQLNGHQMPNGLAMLVGLEQGASVIHWWESVSMPGLLQTEAYAYAVESVGPNAAGSGERARRVALRMRRQQVLERPDGLQLFALLDASVLLRTTGSAAIMAEQVAHLRVMDERPNVHVRVVPLDQRAHAAGSGPFTLITGQESESPYVVVTHNVMGPDYSEIAMMVQAYETLFWHLWREESHGLAQVEL